MNANKDFESYAINRERSKSKHSRYLEFEHTLRYCLCDLKDKTDRDDDFLLNDIKQTVIVYLMRNDYSELNNVFLSNMKNDFYRATTQLRERHSDLDWKMKVIELFMEDFYFDKTNET